MNYYDTDTWQEPKILLLWPPGRIQTDYFHPLETMGLIIIIIIIIIVIIITIIVIIIITRQNTDWPFPPIGNLPLFQDTSHNGDRRLSGQRRSVIFFLLKIQIQRQRQSQRRSVIFFCSKYTSVELQQNWIGRRYCACQNRIYLKWFADPSRHQPLSEADSLFGAKMFFLAIVTFRDKRFCHTNRNLFYTNTNSFHI